MHPDLALPAIAWEYEVVFDAEECLGWYWYDFAHCVMMRSLNTLIRAKGPVLCPEVIVEF